MDIDRFSTLKELREQRQRIVADVRERSSEGDVETEYLERAESDADALTARINELEQRDERLKRVLNNPGNIERMTPDGVARRDNSAPVDFDRNKGGYWLESQPAVRHAANQLRAIRGLPALNERALAGSGTTGGGAFTPADQPDMFFDLLAASSVMLEAGIQRITTNRDSVIIPRLTADASSAWYAEAATITPTDPTADQVTATPRKRASITVVSNEALVDSQPALLNVVSQSLARSLALGYDLAAIEGSGTPPEPRGLKNVSGIQTSSMGTNGAIPTNLDPFADAIGLLETSNARAGAIILHPRTWRTLLKIKEASGSAKSLMQSEMGVDARPVRTLFGTPVFLSSQVNVTETQGTSGAVASSAYVFDPTQVFAVFRQETQVEVDSSRLFNSDQSEVRAIMRADLAVANASAVVRILGILA